MEIGREGAGEFVMPGPVSDSFKGTPDWAPYAPSWNYPNSAPKMCPCGHHEGYHAGPGARCIHAVDHDRRGCPGLPADCFTSEDQFYAPALSKDKP